LSILETRDLCHDFDGLKVLWRVNLRVERGERHAIIGPNGAGKTTLFNLITGTYTPRGGRILFKDRDVTAARPHARVRFGMGRSFQITSTFSRLTTFENVRMGILGRRGIRFNLVRRVDTMQDVTAEAEEVLRRINLTAERDRPAHLLSYGKHRALEISLALTTEPDLVLLDEPTAGMSRDETRNAVELIRRLTGGRTVVIIEHDMDVVFSLADRITVLHHGEILATGSPAEIKANQAVKDAYLGEISDA
jgi:branched-chain amino acid transport system ATP-binding protein